MVFSKSWSSSRRFPINIFLERLNKNDFEGTNFEMFEVVVHNFGKSDDDMI